MFAVISADGDGYGSKPKPANFSRTSGSASTLRTSSLTLAMIAGGTPFGANSATHALTSSPGGPPASVIVGTVSNPGTRFGPAMARNFTLPARHIGPDDAA